MAKDTTKKTTAKAVATIVPADAETKLQEISSYAKGVMAKASKVTITKSEDVVKATEILGTIKAGLKRIKEVRDEYVKPLKEVAKKLEARFNEQSAPYEQAEAVIKRAIADFTLAEEKKRQEAERKLQDEALKQQAKAEKKGVTVPFTPAPIIPKAEATVRGNSGSTTTKKVWKFEVVNIEELINAVKDTPALSRFISANEVAIRGAVAEGARNIPGVRIYEDIQVSVKTN